MCSIAAAVSRQRTACADSREGPSGTSSVKPALRILHGLVKASTQFHTGVWISKGQSDCKEKKEEKKKKEKEEEEGKTERK